MTDHLGTLSLEEQIDLNRMAQSQETVDQAAAWFEGFGTAKKQQILRALSQFAAQAGARDDDAEEATSASGLRAGHTQAVLLRKGPIRSQLTNITMLPAGESERSFRLLFSLLRVAERRRRSTRCRESCTHWWHRDLTDPEVVADIVAETSAFAGALEEFVRRQRTLLDALGQQAPRSIPSVVAESSDRVGTLVVGDDVWRFHHHGAGVCFKREGGPTVNIHTRWDAPELFDAWRLQTYFGSMGPPGVKLVAAAVGRRGVPFDKALPRILDELARLGVVVVDGAGFRLKRSREAREH